MSKLVALFLNCMQIVQNWSEKGVLPVDESGKSIVKFKGKSEKIMSIGCSFPSKFANSGTLSASGF